MMKRRGLGYGLALGHSIAPYHPCVFITPAWENNRPYSQGRGIKIQVADVAEIYRDLYDGYC
jgi:hypothetical protein